MRRKKGLAPRQKLVLAAMDVLLLIELAASLHYGSQDPEAMAARFMRMYVPLLVVTVGGAIFLIRRFRPRPPRT